MKLRTFRAVSAGAALLFAAGVAVGGERATPREAKALFDQAVKYMAANGPEKAFSAFNDRKGAFVKKDLYVFVIDQQGVYRANGVLPDTLVGLNVLETRDAAGKPLFHQMLDAVKSDAEAKVDYVWLNRKDNKVEPKTTFLHRDGDYVLGVGYYAPRSTADDARRLLKDAVALVNRDGMAKAAQAFDDPKGPYVHNDLYVFAVNLETGRFEAMGMNPTLVGNEVRDMRDVEGHPIVDDMIGLARRSGQGSISYLWRNPVTNAVERKRSFIHRVGRSLVGVGYYTAE